MIAEHRMQTGNQSTGQNILVVDDEAPVRGLLAYWLGAQGYRCAQAATAEEALLALEGGNFELLVADILMPGKSGIELLAAVRQRYPDVAAIMVTAVDDRQTAIRALELGAYGYVIKPFEENEVIINVVNAFERRRLVLESQGYERSLEQRLREQTQEIRASREEISLRLMSAQEYRHDETGAHIRRMGLYAEVLARHMDCTEEQAEILRLGAPMHDVGKIGVPDSILTKPGKLTEDEFDIMKTHTTIGGRILERSHIPLVNVARDIAVSHHERWDGSGYPQGISGENIPETARMVAVVDVYDALVHRRVYRAAMPEDEALAIMAAENGSHFDTSIYEVFLQALPQFRSIQQRIKDEGDNASAIAFRRR